MRNDVPGGAEGLLVPPAGVARAGGTPGRVLIEQLRASVRALEQVPVSLGLPPAPGTGPSRPACSLFSPPSDLSTSPGKGEDDAAQLAASGGGLVMAFRESPEPLPGPFPLQGKGISPRQALAVRAARDQAGLLPRRPRRSRLRPCRTRSRRGQARAQRSRALVPDPRHRARMGAPLRTRPHRPGPRPRLFPHRRDQDGARRRLGARRGAEEPGAHRRAWPGRDQGRAREPPPRSSRAGLAHALSPPLRSHARMPADGSPRNAHPLARRRGAERACPLRCRGTRRSRLACDLGALPGRGAGTKFHRGVQS